MSIGFQKRGLFGAPGFGTKNKYDLEQPMPMAAQEPKKPGFFGEGGAGRGIAGAIGDYLLQTSGMRPIYAPQQQYKQHMANQQKLMEQQRQWGLQDYETHKQIDQRYPAPQAPDAFDRALAGANITSGSPEAIAAYRDRVAALSANPNDEFVQVTGLPGGMSYAGPKSGLPGAIGGQARPAKIIPQRPQGATDQQLFDQARQAVESGANVDDVFRQLRAWGVKVQ